MRRSASWNSPVCFPRACYFTTFTPEKESHQEAHLRSTRPQTCGCAPSVAIRTLMNRVLLGILRGILLGAIDASMVLFGKSSEKPTTVHRGFADQPARGDCHEVLRGQSWARASCLGP